MCAQPQPAVTALVSEQYLCTIYQLQNLISQHRVTNVLDAKT